MGESEDALMFRRLCAEFADPGWLDRSKLAHRKGALWGLLVALLGLYGLKWGTGAVRAVECLVGGEPPSGRWLDAPSAWPFTSAVVAGLAFIVLRSASGSWLPPRPSDARQWRNLGLVGMAWATPLFLTRVAGLFLPGVSCAGSPPLIPLLSPFQLSGPAEEVWFAAAIAVWMLLSVDHPRIKLLGVVVGGGVLRGIFHVYQGWASIGLFVWGACAALAVAVTGRWLLLFVLHYVNNALVNPLGVHSVVAAGCIFLVCLATYYVANRAVGASASRGGLTGPGPSGG